MSGGNFENQRNFLPRAKIEEIFNRLKTDPTKVSVVPSLVRDEREVARNEQGHPVMLDGSGRRFHKIEDEPRDQMFLARLLKGIIPVSDVVYLHEKDEFYSYEIPLHLVNSNIELFDASRDILGWVFADYDHHGAINSRRQGEGHVFFDFAGFEHFWGVSGESYLYELRQSVALVPDKEREVLGQILDKLTKQLGQSEGYKFIQSIVENMKETGAGVPWIIRGKEKSCEDPIKDFQEEVMRRIEAVQDGLAHHEE